MSYYLDNAATTELSASMKEYLIAMLDVFGNPSSAHSEGAKANTLIENVRQKVRDFIHADHTEEILFTSSGSASNTLGIYGFARAGECTVLYSPTSHKSVLKVINGLSDIRGVYTHELRVDARGNIDVNFLNQAMESLMVDNSKRLLVVVEYANSEIGTIQDIKKISNVAHRYNGKLFVDCTGSISTIPLNVIDMNIDMASFSAHKIGALKGVGVLYKKNNVVISPLVYGSQEQGLFAGTENVLGILSLGKAVDLLNYNKTAYGRDFVWNKLKLIDGVRIIGEPIEGNRLINNLYVYVNNINGGDLVTMMDDVYKTQISTGSACNNGSPTPSHSLLAIGMSYEDALCGVRISFNGYETEEDLDKFCENFKTCVTMLRDV